ncbi:carbohydrate ABC transporter ATP-binding protein, CUT1 family [Paenibacillaceae bacterium GAS479]|nr:carbohydrate ABC transporter ATP-binding protein, CUT1 family [Paenibacillaceae bacterium GAS479]
MKIELKQVTKAFNKQGNAVNDLSLTIQDGEFVALLGPSGCGKSTTMLMLAGIYKPTDGTIYFDNEPINHVEPKDRNIGMVFQSYALYPHMTVLENIMFPLKQMKVPKSDRVFRAHAAAEQVQLGHLTARKPSELSGGQQQRVALARAIVKKPRLLLLDEPLSNLDARMKIEMREEIRHLQKEIGITTVMVTHDQEEAMTIADRVAVMKDGSLIQYSTPMDLYNKASNLFVAQFIGTPPMNFISGDLMKLGESYTFQENQQSRLIGIRPYDLKLGDQGNVIMNATVSLVEPLGHSNLVSARIGDKLVRFFADASYRAERGTSIVCSADLQKIAVFDKSTGQSIDTEHCIKEAFAV